MNLKKADLSVQNDNEQNKNSEQYIIDPEQLTTSTTIILSLSPDFNFKQSENENNLQKQKSVESVQSTLSECEELVKKEKWYSLSIQVFIPFMLAGIGTVGAGIVLANVENYPVFKAVRALYVLVPSLLGLKGNLDMCLASRLSTQANLGNMKGKREIAKMIIGNIGLVQVQAIVASVLVAIFAVCTYAAINEKFSINQAFLLMTCSILTATLSCFTLDFVLISVIFLSHRLKLNPDNLATPLAASVGDVVSLLVLSSWARLLFTIYDTHLWILLVIIGIYVFMILPGWIMIVRKNEYTSKVLTRGWTPVLSALVISGTGGLVLDTAVEQFPGYVTFQPIINGIGGNLVSVHASRISTMLHKTSIKGVIPPHTKQWVAPWTALIGGVFSAKTARILILMAVPGQIIFCLTADVIANDGILTAQTPFVATYVTCSIVQVMVLLYLAHLLVHTLWKLKMDPDNSAIPYLTALGDLLGSTILLLAFIFLRSINQEYTY